MTKSILHKLPEEILEAGQGVNDLISNSDHHATRAIIENHSKKNGVTEEWSDESF